MAIQLAGGLADSAKDTAIKITRKTDGGAPKTIEIDLRAAASKGEVQNDILLEAGDVVYVPEKVF